MDCIERLRALEKDIRNSGGPGCQYHADQLASLIAELGQEVGAVGDGTCYDRGPWRWERTGSKVDVFSDDFTCDVALRIDGDFATDDVADSYAKWLADTLNGHITSPAHTSESRDACRWNQEDDGGECFGTSCGHHYLVIDADTDGLSFCVYCGGRLIAEKWRDEDEDAAMRQERGNG